MHLQRILKAAATAYLGLTMAFPLIANTLHCQTAIARDQYAQNREHTVVLVHGILAPLSILIPLRYRLERVGFKVEVWSYDSPVISIAEHAQRFRTYLAGYESHQAPYHIVAHSLGAIVARAALANYHHKFLDRMVMLAPPNQGTTRTQVLPDFIRRRSMPLTELAAEPSSLVNKIDELADVSVGIIAARYDVLVPRGYTHLREEHEHITINATHNSMLLTQDVAMLVKNYLESGSFGENVMGK